MGNPARQGIGAALAHAFIAQALVLQALSADWLSLVGD
jgi:hypothetical protein